MSSAFNDSFHQDFKNETLLPETKVGSIYFDINFTTPLKFDCFWQREYIHWFVYQDFKFEYAEHGDIAEELFWRGMISLTLTCINILCIIIVGVLMLLVKQVTVDLHANVRSSKDNIDQHDDDDDVIILYLGDSREYTATKCFILEEGHFTQ